MPTGSASKREYSREYYRQNKHKWSPRTREQRDRYNAERRRKYAECEAERQKARNAAKRWQEANPERRLAQRLRKYGITPDEYRKMLNDQRGGCAICGSGIAGEGRSGGRMHVDHCHDTGRVRGLLCANCNHGIGKFKDDPSLLIKAAVYLRDRQAVREDHD